MAATITTLDAILKEFYVGPIQDQLNQEVLALELLRRQSWIGAGSKLLFPSTQLVTLALVRVAKATFSQQPDNKHLIASLLLRSSSTDASRSQAQPFQPLVRVEPTASRLTLMLR